MVGPMLKLLYCSNAYTTHDYRFLKAFVDAGWGIDWIRLSSQCFDCRDIPVGVNRVWDCKLKSAPFGPRECLSLLPIIRSAVNASAPDVVLAGTIHTGAWLMARAGARPLVAMSWGSDLLADARTSLGLEKMSRYTLQKSAGLLCDCRVVRQSALSFANFANNQVCLIPWGIDHPLELSTRAERNMLRQQLGWDGCTILLSVRSWESVYDIDTLVRAFSHASRKHAELRLLLLGDGSLAQDIRGLIRNEDLDHLVYMPGRIAQSSLSTYYQAADIYVTTALSDGTSVSLLEAMAHRLPVLASATAGNAEWIENNSGGWLFEPGDAASLEEAINVSLLNIKRFESIGSENQRIVVSRADWDRNVSDLLAFLNRIARSADSTEAE